MTTINEPLFTQVGTDGRGISAYDRVEGQEYENRARAADETPTDTRFPVPLYVIAAAALLG